MDWYKQNQSLFLKYTSVDGELKKIQYVKPISFFPIKDHLTGFGRVTDLEILNQTPRSYGAIVMKKNKDILSYSIGSLPNLSCSGANKMNIILRGKYTIGNISAHAMDPQNSNKTMPYILTDGRTVASTHVAKLPLTLLSDEAIKFTYSQQ